MPVHGVPGVHRAQARSVGMLDTYTQCVGARMAGLWSVKLSGPPPHLQLCEALQLHVDLVQINPTATLECIAKIFPCKNGSFTGASDQGHECLKCPQLVVLQSMFM